MLINRYKISSVVLCGVLLLNLMAGSLAMADEGSMTPAAIAQRLAPVGRVTIAGQPLALDASVTIAGLHRSGQEVYEATCHVCHSIGAAGSPKLGDKLAWMPRLKQGMEVLLKHALNGYNFMPPRGTCSDCSDAEIKAAISYMTSHSR